VSVRAARVTAASPAKLRASARQSTKLGYDVTSLSIPCRGLLSQTRTSWSDSGYGIGRSSTPYTMLSTAVVTPMPSAIVRMMATLVDRLPCIAR
jgi:hypothetical protein